MKTVLPENSVSADYIGALENFVSLIRHRQKGNIRSIYLSGSYARGDATDSSDVDIWCIFDHLDSKVLQDVGPIARELPVSYEQLEFNSQCFSIDEFNSRFFENWIERPVKILEAVLLYGEDLCGDIVSRPELEKIYKKYLADILMSIRHYICVDEPVENLTYRKIRANILKPLMFSMRMERYCAADYYPISNSDLLKSYDDSRHRILVEYFLDQQKYEYDMSMNHREVFSDMQDLVSELIYKQIGD